MPSFVHGIHGNEAAPSSVEHDHVPAYWGRWIAGRPLYFGWVPTDSVQTDRYVAIINWPALVLTVATLVAVMLVVVLVVRRIRRDRRPAATIPDK
jgi:hypothetical protein